MEVRKAYSKKALRLLNSFQFPSNGPPHPQSTLSLPLSLTLARTLPSSLTSTLRLRLGLLTLSWWRHWLAASYWPPGMRHAAVLKLPSLAAWL